MRTFGKIGAILAVALSAFWSNEGYSSEIEPADLVVTLQGSNSVREFSTGNTYPAVALPWGMNFWTPQTRVNGDGWQYVYTDKTIQGFKQTHQPSPWINDYGCFSVMPQIDEAIYDEAKRAVGFSHDREQAHPYYYAVELDNGIKSEVAPTNSGAIFRFSYPESGKQIVLIDCYHHQGEVTVDRKKGIVTGLSRFYADNNNAVLPENFATYFTMEFDAPIAGYGVFEDGKKIENQLSAKGERVSLYIEFANLDVLEAKVASSFIGVEQAALNLKREIGDSGFEDIKSSAFDKWNSELQKVEIAGGTLEEQRTFYSALYRTMLFPRRTHEYDASGNEVHYSFFTGELASGAMFADNGFWDTFRAVHPFFTIMHPSVTEELMEALLNIYDEGGYLPEWFSPAYKNCMIGQNSVSVVTDALVKGVDGFDKEKMFEAMVKGANSEGPNATGRKGFESYNQKGYVACDLKIRGTVSSTLEYAYNDYCIAKYAKAIGKDQEVVDLYNTRAMNYKNVFDTSINFVRPKTSDGEWFDEYAPDMWGGAFTEGCAWHWTWCVFHDPKGLIDLMGGDEQFVAKLDSVFTAPPTINMRYYRSLIHEATEMIAGNMGQYAHGNQPIQHMPYLYNYAGAAYKTQYHTRNIMRKLYSSGYSDGKGLCGDEDNGQTSAWYVFSSLGFYPVCPGSAEYIIGSPLFNEITLTLENGNKFTVVANNNSDENIYIQSATLNGKSFDRGYINHSEIMDGGTLVFEMGSEPNKEWASSQGGRPFSMSDL